MPHANVNWGFGPLRYVIVSPAYHRLHHDRDDRRGVNLGTVLVLWDVLAGSGRVPGTSRDAGGRPVPVPTGLAGRPLPVEQATAAPGSVRTMGRQLWSPIQGGSGIGDGERRVEKSDREPELMRSSTSDPSRWASNG